MRNHLKHTIAMITMSTLLVGTASRVHADRLLLIGSPKKVQAQVNEWKNRRDDRMHFDRRHWKGLGVASLSVMLGERQGAAKGEAARYLAEARSDAKKAGIKTVLIKSSFATPVEKKHFPATGGMKVLGRGLAKAFRWVGFPLVAGVATGASVHYGFGVDGLVPAIGAYLSTTYYTLLKYNASIHD